MSRFYVPPENVKDGEIVIDGNEAHHILDVMRMKDEDKVVVFDGTGNEYTGFIKSSDRPSKIVIVEIVRTDKPATDKVPEITIAQAIPKKSRMDYIVEKMTELGVARVIPVISQRTVVRPDDESGKKKVERWQKIAVEAAKQCGRTSVPEIGAITGFGEIAVSLDRYDLVLLACLSDRTNSLKESLAGFRSGKILVLIGPEGDFTPEEIRLAYRDNCKPVSLGQRVLKSDTAGLFVLSVLTYEFSL